MGRSFSTIHYSDTYYLRLKLIYTTFLYIITYFPSQITSSLLLGAFFAAPFAAPLADTYGRKICINSSSLIIVVGAIIQAAARDPFEMIAGRVIVGAAIGLLSACVPMYLAEGKTTNPPIFLLTPDNMYYYHGFKLIFIIIMFYCYTVIISSGRIAYISSTSSSKLLLISYFSFFLSFPQVCPWLHFLHVRGDGSFRHPPRLLDHSRLQHPL